MKKLILTITIAAAFASCKSGAEDVDAYGNFEATTTTISAEASGKLVQFGIEEGQLLKAGALVAIVDTTNLILQKQKLQASLGTLPSKLRNTLADIAVLENKKTNVLRERNRLQRLVKKKAATTKQLDDVNGQLDVIGKQIEAIRSQTNTANGAILAEKEPILAQMAIVNQQIKNCYISNPVKGSVLTKLAEPYELVRAGSPLYRIGDLSSMTLRFYLDAVQLQQVKLNDAITIKIDDGKEGYSSLDGSIVWIASEAEFTPKTIQTKEDRVNLVYAVKAKVKNNGSLKIGMPAEVVLSSSETE